MIERLAEEFRRIVVDAGYRFGIYCNLDWFNNVISEKLKKYDFWIARYPSDDNGTLPLLVYCQPIPASGR